MALYLCTAHKKGISSYQLAKDIGIAQKSAWFMLHRLRELMSHIPKEKLMGAVEIDETYMSRKYASDYVGLSPEQVEYIRSTNHSTKTKGVVVGMAERGGIVRVVATNENRTIPVQKIVKDNIVEGSRLLTDESNIYKSGLEQYQHSSVRHSAKEWVRNDVHTNTVENFWSVMRRGVYGIYHQISYKHLQRYCDEYAYRYNSRKISDKQRFTNSLKQIEGRLDYKTLTGKK